MIADKATARKKVKSECDFPDCSEEVFEECKFCKRPFCDLHIKPKHTGISFGLKEPELIKIYEEDDKRIDGHPCPEYQVWWRGEYEKRLEANASDFNRVLDWIKDERELVTTYGYCRMSECNSGAIKKCRYCKRDYCSAHLRPNVVPSLPSGRMCMSYIHNKKYNKHEPYGRSQ